MSNGESRNPTTHGEDEAPIWRPSPARVAASQMNAFLLEARERSGRPLASAAELHRWSIEEPETFWALVWDDCDVVGERGSSRVLEAGDRMPGARWFPDARLNFAENLLRRRDDQPAVIFRGEDGGRRELDHRALAAAVARTAAALVAAGVRAGDRVAGVLPNIPEALIGLLASSSLGAIWSSCSPDFGVNGVSDRFGQIEPKVLLCADGYTYNHKVFDTLRNLPDILAALPSVERCLVVAHLADGLPDDRLQAIEAAAKLPVESFEEFSARHRDAALEFRRLPFDHPLAILYSSGTTGKPKCIVHGAGGSLLQHLKEHRLHVDLRAADRFFYFTTCGWMMWNWLVSGLASEATLVLYDGSPFAAGRDGRPGTLLFDIAEEEGIAVFGSSAKFIDALAKAGLEPVRSHDLEALRTVLSTGSPLVPEGFDYVYEKLKADVHLASISGGTDILSCFVLGNPLLPVWRGEIQGPGLGMAVRVLDDEGNSSEGEMGELVCAAPFPSMPVGFWKDDSGERYRAAYFERYPGLWHHGDWIRETEHGGYVITGRSDAVLNPGGVRIGTAEIYRAVERIDEVVESIAIGQDWEGDVRVVLFVVLREAARLDDGLVERIRNAVREGTTPRHVPARVLEVADIPRTRSGKITELAVREVVHGRAVKNAEALANPEALEHFRDRPELAS